MPLKDKDIRNSTKYIMSFLGIIGILCSFTVMFLLMLPINSYAKGLNMERQSLSVDGEEHSVDAIIYDYDNNLYLSLRDVAEALNQTDRRFDVSINSEEINITRGERYSPYEEEEYPWGEEYISELTNLRKQNKMNIDGREVKYYTLLMKGSDGVYDCFMSVIDLSMILDVGLDMEDGNRIVYDSLDNGGFDALSMESFGLFEGINAALVGDATTGEVYYGYNADNRYPIASTTKLMTYLLTMEAVSKGDISLDTMAIVSKEGEVLARGGDGVLPLRQDMEISVSELIKGAMIASSNECAFTLAETIGGSEPEFCEMMNAKAQELGLENTRFYNSHGLPVYTREPYPGKISNYMTARDMFNMCSYIMAVYPQITEVTSLKKASLDAIGQEVKTTNALLYNIEEITGLKTGTTNKAGCCLVSSLRVDGHDLIVVLFGAETGYDRTQISEVLCRYAMKVYNGEIKKNVTDEENPSDDINNAEGMIKKVLNLLS